MDFLRCTTPRGWVVALVALLAAGCSSPAFRDFAAVPTPVATERAAAVPELINYSDDELADLGPLLAQTSSRAQIPGFAAVVLQGNHVVAQGVAGVRRQGTDVRVTIDDQFQIASCAKAMSAMLVARLVENGKLEWDRPISGYLPGESLHPDWDKVTLRHLLTHTAGLRDPLLRFLSSTTFDRGTLAERRWAFVQKVLHSKPSSPPGNEVNYCNIDYILAAAVAEKVTGISWEEMMMNTLFVPLGLESAGFGPPGQPNQILQPWGHGKYRLIQVDVIGNTSFDPGARTADYPAVASPAGYVHLSIRDWARFVALHLRAHKANPHRTTTTIDHQTFDTLHQLRPGVGYAGGWFVEERSWAKGSRAADSGRVLFHVGDNGRWTSAVWLAPEIDFAVLVTCNRGDMSTAVDEVVSQLVGKYARLRVMQASDF